jgi:Family of unknown function (DUF6152)
MRNFLTSTIAAAALLIGGSAWAHHPFASEYDANKPAHFEGKVTKVDWINPHAFLTVVGKADNGKVETWRIELGSPGALTKTGWKRASVKTGDEVEIKGWYARDGKHIINAEGLKVTRTGLELDARSSYHDTKAAN